MSSSDRDILDARKKAEVEFHNRKRSVDPVGLDYDPICPTRKYYSINRSSSRLVQGWLSHRCRDKRVLVYGCGDGWQCLPPARSGAHVTGIDISDVSIEIAKKNARAAGLSQISFEIMDCEALTFADSSFDIVVAAAILHHLSLPKAYSEIARVLKPDGEVICVEPLAHNPLIQLYRRHTPTLRTDWELHHILRVEDLKLARRYFRTVNFRFVHLFTLFAVPFRNTRAFSPLLSAMEAVDSLVLRIPLIGRFAWQVVFTLAEPRKEWKEHSAVRSDKPVPAA